MIKESSIRVGCDLVLISDVHQAIQRHGDRYLRRVFGITTSSEESHPPARTLAGRFAAKEAFAKAIGVGGRPFPWTDVTIEPDPDGRPALLISGVVAGYAGDMGVAEWDVSVTNEGNYAMAIVSCVVDRNLDRSRWNAGGAAIAAGGESSTDSGKTIDDMQGIRTRVRDTLAAAIGGHLDVDDIGESDDLFASGMTSHQTVQVMLGLEDEFEIEFPDDMLTRSTFSSIDAMTRAVSVLA